MHFLLPNVDTITKSYKQFLIIVSVTRGVSNMECGNYLDGSTSNLGINAGPTWVLILFGNIPKVSIPSLKTCAKYSIPRDAGICIQYLERKIGINASIYLS